MAAALPFVRTPLLPSAVVIGTMAPDVPYYLPLRVPRDLTHSPLGVPTIDLAITVVLVLLWYAVLRAPIVDVMPAAIRQRMPELGALGWRRGRSWPAAIALMVLGALVGILTHLLWDLFTHRGWVTDTFPVFAAPLGTLPLVAWLQHASTVLGLVLLAVWAVLWVRRTAADAGRRSWASDRGRAAVWVCLVLAFVGTGIVVSVGHALLGISPFEPSPVFNAVTNAGAAVGIVGVAICAIWWFARRVRRQ